MEIVSPDFIAVKSFRAKGKRITNYEVESITEIEPIPIEEETIADAEVQDEESSDIEILDDGRSEDEVRDEITGQQRIF